MTRLSLSDTIRDVVLKLAGGNPGALRVITELLAKEDGILHVMKLDDLRIYESLIWLCYKDMLKCDIDKFYDLLKTNKLALTIEDTLKTNPRFKQEWEYTIVRIKR